MCQKRLLTSHQRIASVLSTQLSTYRYCTRPTSTSTLVRARCLIKFVSVCQVCSRYRYKSDVDTEVAQRIIMAVLKRPSSEISRTKKDNTRTGRACKLQVGGRSCITLIHVVKTQEMSRCVSKLIHVVKRRTSWTLPGRCSLLASHTAHSPRLKQSQSRTAQISLHQRICRQLVLVN